MTQEPLAELLLATLEQKGREDGYRVFHPLLEVGFDIGQSDWRGVLEASGALERDGLVELIFKVRGAAARVTADGARHARSASWMEAAGIEPPRSEAADARRSDRETASH